ncbi:aldehyde dehydrogenase (plasmid) [Phaeobacter inhibens]|uniref:Aldehyde dehydrogenase n=1 Tax=Phaeobacter inhibens TaxID=221822 RepID=A0ABN5GWS0_9RHOB|nr:aldehyde dehydrogenase family protein [Phaeobacter inhibens]AUQ52451.1 aldehyde dehydrogenase [Phaeobacter inhibens]AUQ97056.1 aldehyde dehydrogenase [Phaeobacter inhibens]AUR22256.1 aldehyde dehydrogenase [Phaeobacter inhibens]
MEKLNLIAGEWVSGAGWAENINPSDTNDVIGHYARATAEQSGQAIAAAKAAAPGWAQATPQMRADALEAVGVELLARKEELGELLSREEGKIRSEGIGEVTRAAHVFKFYAQEALRVEGLSMASVRPGVRVEVRLEPVGVVGLITPWNYPIAIPAWKIAPALAYGNTVVFKPADLTPGCGWALAEILSRAGLPAGVFNLVMGRGSAVGDEIVRSPDVAAVSFTGSEHTGAAIRTRVAERGGKVQQEMGGKSPLIVMDDADLQTAIDCAIGGSVLSTGQRCTSNTRIITTPGIHDALVAGMVDAARALKVGHALDPSSQIGPAVDERQLQTNLRYIGIADNEGAERLCGGEVLTRETPGFYMEPTVYGNCTNQMQHVREEIFGPVVSVLKAADYDEAVSIANDSPLGLSSGICTTSLKYAEDFKARSHAGMVMVNLPTAGVDYHVPFGGRKGSSYGSREQGRAAREFFTTSKTTYTSF